MGLVDRDMRSRQWPALTRAEDVPRPIHVNLEVRFTFFFDDLSHLAPGGQHFIRQTYNALFRPPIVSIMPLTVPRHFLGLKRHIRNV